MSADAWAIRIRESLGAACHPERTVGASVATMAVTGFLASWPPAGVLAVDRSANPSVSTDHAPAIDVDALVVSLFEQEGQSLVRLARLFVDDRNAAEDLVQEAFIRLARSAHRIKDPSKAAPYLRSIVLNLARDNNRRGLVSLRHHLPQDDHRASTEDEIELQEDQQQVIDALRELPHRQRNALVLRYYEELGIDDIAIAMGISRNSVKTHLRRGLASLEQQLGDAIDPIAQPAATAR